MRTSGQTTKAQVDCLPMSERIQLLPGTLEMLVLQTLVFGPRHGHGIAVAIKRGSQDSLLVDHGSLYPALQRLEQSKWIASEWGTSENNRRARFYKLTRTGRTKLAAATSKWEKTVRAVSGVLGMPREEES
jgi:PadR family transcriptional regulator PadR